MFQRRLHHNEVVGFEATLDSALFFFGTRHCSAELLQTLYPKFEFSFLKQMHGNRLVTAPAARAEADGQTTTTANLALVIQTADCLPILLSGKSRIAAVHAGWRGLTANIIDAAASFGPFQFAAIGPHIRVDSYEVGLEVADQLVAAGSADATLTHPNRDKKWVDLAKIAQMQLHRSHPEAQVAILPDDTFRSLLFHSFRRGKQTSDRQYSFVALLGNDGNGISD